MNLIKYRAQKNKNVIYRPCSVRIGRYLPSVMKMALGLRPRAIFMTSGKYLPIRTSRPVNNIYISIALCLVSDFSLPTGLFEPYEHMSMCSNERVLICSSHKFYRSDKLFAGPYFWFCVPKRTKIPRFDSAFQALYIAPTFVYLQCNANGL